ncbi:MAG: DUF1428 domain-containing protein [Pseudomonadota bacterium]
MTYVDGFVLAVPTRNRDAYRMMSEKASAVFKKHGALRHVECWGDDVPEGKVTSFTIATQRKPDETAMFSWIEWPSKEVRDTGMKKAMEEFSKMPDMAAGGMPFDGMRMFWGGFEPIVDR